MGLKELAAMQAAAPAPDKNALQLVQNEMTSLKAWMGTEVQVRDCQPGMRYRYAGRLVLFHTYALNFGVFEYETAPEEGLLRLPADTKVTVDTESDIKLLADVLARPQHYAEAGVRITRIMKKRLTQANKELAAARALGDLESGQTPEKIVASRFRRLAHLAEAAIQVADADVDVKAVLAEMNLTGFSQRELEFLQWHPNVEHLAEMIHHLHEFTAPGVAPIRIPFVEPWTLPSCS
ncbi:MAG: hypothetical protein KJ648_07115 [Candidatus Omnitrophica bacterium]|nr:hypothetical protein [Candidatus Omnitrophota bacterium]